MLIESKEKINLQDAQLLLEGSVLILFVVQLWVARIYWTRLDVKLRSELFVEQFCVSLWSF